MKKYIIKGGKELEGTITISGSKNVVSKVIVAASLTKEEVEITNVPYISDLLVALEVAEELGAEINYTDHTLKIKFQEIKTTQIPLSAGVKSRASTLFLGPLLARCRNATVPNPGGCRLGARPIERHIEGLEQMGAVISYISDDGYFHATAPDGLHGTTYTFEKNTHTGTETLILAAVLAKGKTVLHNAAEEPEIDDLILLLNSMGANVIRLPGRIIEIEGVEELHGATHKIMPDRNESVTFAILSTLTGGKIYLKDTDLPSMQTFLDNFKKANGKYEETEKGVRFFVDGDLLPVDIVTQPHPGFMTDWQGTWSVLMTQALGVSTIHETIYENRFSYVSELVKMGAKLEFFKPEVSNPEEFYNFNFDEGNDKHRKQGLRIFGKSKLHNAVLDIADLRAGATLVIACLIAKGESSVYGVEHIERGYENFNTRLQALGADIVMEEDLP